MSVTVPKGLKASLKKRLLILLLAGGMAFVVGELAARSMLGVPWPELLPLSRVEAHPTRGWRMVPNETHYTYDHLVRVNALGMRGDEVGDKKPGSIRVLALGDSLVYGQGASCAETVPTHLESILNELDDNGRAWEVLNGGNRAYDTRQELALLEELGPELKPDVVFLFWFHNDLFGRDMAETAKRLEESGPIAFDVGTAMNGKETMVWRLKQLPRRSALAMALYDRILHPESVRIRLPESWDARFAEFDQLLDRFLELEHELGFELVFGVIPFGPFLGHPEHWGAEIERRAIKLVQSKGIPARQLDQRLREVTVERGSPPVIPFDGHYLSEGNAAIAQDAASFVLEVL